MRTVIFLLPVYNEGERLDTLLTRIKSTMEGAGLAYRVAAVDDGSTDDSPAILRRRAADLPLEVITHRFNRGLGETCRDGLEWVADHAGEDDVVVTMDADDTHDPGYVPAMLAAIDRGADVVIGSRFQPGAEVRGVPQHRQAFSVGANLLLRTFLRIPGVRDYACGFRAIRASLVRRAVLRLGNRLLELREWGFICTAELLWKLSLFGARCDEVPFVLRYDLKAGASKMRAMRTIFGYGLLIWKRLAGPPAVA
jgi:dolichol-phosphate mannosyltransferase